MLPEHAPFVHKLSSPGVQALLECDDYNHFPFDQTRSKRSRSSMFCSSGIVELLCTTRNVVFVSIVDSRLDTAPGHQARWLEGSLTALRKRTLERKESDSKVVFALMPQHPAVKKRLFRRKRGDISTTELSDRLALLGFYCRPDDLICGLDIANGLVSQQTCSAT